jgi:hypothetical protein
MNYKEHVRAFVASIEKYYGRYPNPERGLEEFSVKAVVSQYIQKTIPQFAYGPLYSALVRTYTKRPDVAQIERVWIDIKDHTYPPEDLSRKRISDTNEPYASKEEVSVFLHELNTVLNPRRSPEDRERMIQAMQRRYL